MTPILCRMNFHTRNEVEGGVQRIATAERIVRCLKCGRRAKQLLYWGEIMSSVDIKEQAE